MIKKIFFGSVFIITIILVINHVSHVDVNRTNNTRAVAKFDLSGEVQQYRPVETKVEILPNIPIPKKATVTIKVEPKVNNETTVKPVVKAVTKSVVKPVVKKIVKPRIIRTRRTYYTSRYGTTMRWDAASLRFLSNIAAFDYSYSIRATIIRKIEKYAREHHISEVTMSMMNAEAESE